MSALAALHRTSSTSRRTTSRMAILSLLAALALCGAGTSYANSVAPGAPSGTITPTTPCVTIPVDLTRVPLPGTAARRFGVTIELSAELDLCTAPPPAILQGPWLPAGNVFTVTPQGSNRWLVEGVFLGNTPCGNTDSGRLFTVSVRSVNSTATSGSLRIVTADLNNCVGAALPLTATTTPVTVPITPPSPPGPVTLAVQPITTGNGDDGTIRLRLSWTPNVPVEIYRAKFGNEPEYDDPPSGALLHRINFQPSNAPLVPGFTADFGDIFDAGRGYGWNVQVECTARTQLPSNNPQANFARRFNANPAGIWEIVVPNGIYQVHVVCGDAQTSSRNLLNIEGATVFDNVLANGGSFITDTRAVTVNDNRLTMQIGGAQAGVPTASETKICFIEIGTAAPGGTGGVEPSIVTAFPPPAGYTLWSSPATGPIDDEPADRDEYYYVAYAITGLTRSGPSNRVAAINYHLGDFFFDAFGVLNPPPILECVGDNLVGLADLSFFGAFYNTTIPAGFLYACLDIGPTSTGTKFGRPLTDNIIDWKDLIIFAQNFLAVSKPQVVYPAASRDVVGLELDEARAGARGPVAQVTLEGAGHLRGLAVRLGWNEQVVRPMGASGAARLASQGGVAFPAGAGGVDFALLGDRTIGLTGAGALAEISFERLAPGDPGIVIASVDARDLAGSPAQVEIDSRSGAMNAPRVSAVLDNTPNPFNPTTRIRFALAQRGMAELAIYSIDGRLVRQLRRETLDAGVHEATWDGTDTNGARVGSGVYYAKLRTNDGKSSHPLVLLK